MSDARYRYLGRRPHAARARRGREARRRAVELGDRPELRGEAEAFHRLPAVRPDVRRARMGIAAAIFLAAAAVWAVVGLVGAS